MYIHVNFRLSLLTEFRFGWQSCAAVCIDGFGLKELQNATLEDVWYELEGAYEVYGIGRCRFVLVHCRNAVLMGLSLKAKEKGLVGSEPGLERLMEELKMPEQLRNFCNMIEMAGRPGSLLKKGPDDQERASYMLGRSLEVFEWIRGEVIDK
jgi:hypothetical protein